MIIFNFQESLNNSLLLVVIETQQASSMEAEHWEKLEDLTQ